MGSMEFANIFELCTQNRQYYFQHEESILKSMLRILIFRALEPNPTLHPQPMYQILPFANLIMLYQKMVNLNILNPLLSQLT